MPARDISVIIPTYNNTTQLVRNLKHNLPYLKGCEIIVVNDYPAASLAKEFEQFLDVTLIENTQNQGFSGTMNRGVSHASHTYVLFLNDDVRLHDDSYKRGLHHFEHDSTICAVSCAQKEKNGETVGKNTIFWNQGFVQHSRAANLAFGITAWAEGGSALFDKEKFESLGGFDTLYAPFYWEDIDLSYRAWKKGYQVLFDPAMMVEHHHESTIGNQFSQKHITSIAYRNQLFFMWKNISSFSLIFQHKLFLLKLLLQAIIKKDRAFLKGFVLALAKAPQVLYRRSTVSSNRTDHEILKLFS